MGIIFSAPGLVGLTAQDPIIAYAGDTGVNSSSVFFSGRLERYAFRTVPCMMMLSILYLCKHHHHTYIIGRYAFRTIPQRGWVTLSVPHTVRFPYH